MMKDNKYAEWDEFNRNECYAQLFSFTDKAADRSEDGIPLDIVRMVRLRSELLIPPAYLHLVDYVCERHGPISFPGEPLNYYGWKYHPDKSKPFKLCSKIKQPDGEDSHAAWDRLILST